MPDLNPFQVLIDTSSLWLPPLTWSVAMLSTTRPGRKIEEAIKSRLKWLKDPNGQRAFQSAFTKGIRLYEQARGHLESARAVAYVLRDVAEHDQRDMDGATFLEQVFQTHPDPERLAHLVHDHFGVITAARVTQADVVAELGIFISYYLRPAFLAEPFFTERVGFAEVIGLLQDIRALLEEPAIDLDTLRSEYKTKIAREYEYITMQGISPKVQNRTIGIRMEDAFIPLRAQPEDAGQWLIWGKEAIRLPRLLHANIDKRLVDQLLRQECSPDFFLFADRSTRIREAEQRAIEEKAFMFVDCKTLRNRSQHDATWNVFRETLRTSPGSRFSQVLKNTLDILLAEISMQDTSQGHTLDTTGYLEAILAARDRSEAVQLSSGNAEIKHILTFPKVVVRGDPGSGKSTLTSYVAWAAATGRSELIGDAAAQRCPLRIRAIELGQAIENGDVDSLEEYLTEKSGRFSSLVRFVLSAGQAIVMIDGLDEVSKPALREKVKDYVSGFVADPAFSDNQVIISTRIVGYERSGNTGAFPHFTLAELDDQQIERFVESWYGAIHQEMPAAIDVQVEKTQLLTAIRTQESIHRLARNPLLLTIIALIKWQGRTLPDQRVQLYDAAAQTLIRTRPETLRNIQLDELLIREWMAPVALHIISQHSGDLVDEFTLQELLVASMMELQSVTEFEARRRSDQLLESVSQHSGIFLPRGTDDDDRTLYGFLHQTFAEYLAAYRLAGDWEDGKLDLRLYAHNPYWREVLLLMAGHLGTQRRAKAGQLVHSIRQLQSSPYESLIHRDLLLAGRILGDGVPIGPGDFVASLLHELTNIWLGSSINALRDDALSVLADLAGTEYAPVLARLAEQESIASADLLRLARVLGVQHFEESLHTMLRSDHLEARIEAARMLLRSGHSGARDALIALLNHEDYRVRMLAAWPLLTERDQETIDTLTRMATFETDELGLEVVIALVELNATDSLAQLLDCSPLPVRLKAAVGLAGIADSRGVDALVTMTGTEVRIDHRLDAACALRQFRETTADEILGDLIQHANPLVRLQAAEVLSEAGNEDALDVLAELSSNPDPLVSAQATELLGLRNDPRATAAMERFLGDNDSDLRMQAAAWFVGQNDARGIAVMAEFLNDPDPRNRLQAASRLIDINGADAQRVLAELQGVDDVSLRWEATQVLLEHGDHVADDYLAELVKSVSSDILMAVASTLFQRNSALASSVLADVLSDSNPDNRLIAAVLLEQSKDQAAFETLVHRLDDLLNDVVEVTALSDGPNYARGAKSVADVAYRFLLRHLTPTGEVVPSAAIT